mmetsp:Transcript_85465/g.250161  ORF Transcript_85465/g.250161 Transcript_85465/m.250161 type:complete len:346 (-) Transcript_85465:168-1205(-)
MAGCCDPASKSFFLYNVPICGGFCAPTKSNEKSCFRHFSNEFTLPAAPRFMKLAPCVEHSCCCVALGKLGFACADRARKVVMMTGCCFNLLALLLLVVATLGGLSTSPGTLAKLAWVAGAGEVQLPGGRAPLGLEISLGLVAQHAKLACLDEPEAAVFRASAASAGFEEPSPGCFEQTTRWEDELACGRGFQDTNTVCEDCRDSLLPTSTLFLSIFTQLPTMATNLQRATRFGDVNCQAGFGVVTNFVSLLSSMASLLAFKRTCRDAMPETVMGGAVVTWKLGPGFMLLLAGTLVKLVDILCHCLVPTPRQRWQAPDKSVQDTASYLGLAPPEREQEGAQQEDKP